MDAKTILKVVLVIALALFALLYFIFMWLRRQERETDHQTLYGKSTQDTPQFKRWVQSFLQSSYVLCLKIPLLSGYVMKIRKRLSSVHAYDEFHLRHESMKLTYAILGSLIGSVIVLALINHSFSFLLIVILAAVVLNSFMVDMYINSLEKRLLKQMVDLFSDVRHRYHQHGMVEESIYEAAESAGYEASLHTRRIYEALVSRDPSEELDRYYEAAPNRFLKAFAGISYMVMEFGDKVRENGSIYLQGLSSLTKEIHLEILRRNKLDYLLKGLNVIALVPIFFTKPIEQWARSSFPAMEEFYLSKLGYLTKISIFLIIILSYMLLQKLQQYDETSYRAGREKKSWEQILSRVFVMRWMAALMAPKPLTRAYGQVVRLLKDTNSTLQLEWFYIRRISFFLLGFSVAISMALFLHHTEKEHILHDPVVENHFFGQMSDEQLEKALRESELDHRVMTRAEFSASADYDQISHYLELEEGGQLKDRDQFVVTVQRILSKLDRYNDEYLKWWELALSLGFGIAGYYLPLWLLYFHKRIRHMDMKHEVYQFHTVISMLREMDRMSVEVILEWMDRFAIIFKIPIQKCLLHYDHGAELALNGLKDEVLFTEFGRIVDKLLLSVDKIPIAEAFDDLESEMSYYFEQRKQEYERIIDMKAEWGRLIGFAPMYALIFLYLVIPLISISFLQMNLYYEQIQNI